jgi:tetratricopeptide (TPR) repeat protein
MGRRFTREAVERIWDRPPGEMDKGLDTLRETETVYEEASRIWGEREVVFRHGRLQEAALARIPREERLAWLARLEDWAKTKIEGLGTQWEGAGPFLLMLIARSRLEHGDAAQASLWQELLGLLHTRHNRPFEAIQSLRQALEQARGVRRLTLLRLISNQERYSGNAEQGLATLTETGTNPAGPEPILTLPAALQQKLAALNPDPLARWETLELGEAQIALELARADTLAHLGQVPEARESFEALQAQVMSLAGKTGVRLQLQWGRTWVHLLAETLGDPQTAAGVIQELRRIIPEQALRQDEERLTLLYMEGLIAFRLGHFDQAQTIAEERLRLSRFRQDRRDEGNALNSLGIALDAQGMLAAAGQAYEQCLTISRAIGDRRGEAIALYNRGEAHFHLGEWDAAQRCQELYLPLSRVIGNRLAEAYAPLSRAGIASEMGDYELAETLILQARKIADANGWRKLSALTWPTLGQLHLRRGLAQSRPELWAGAIADLGSAEEVWGYSDEAGEFYFSLAMLLLLSGAQAEAQAVLTRARERLPRAWLVAHAWLDLSEALVQGRPVEGAHKWFRERGYVRVDAWLRLLGKG